MNVTLCPPYLLQTLCGRSSSSAALACLLGLGGAGGSGGLLGAVGVGHSGSLLGTDAASCPCWNRRACGGKLVAGSTAAGNGSSSGSGFCRICAMASLAGLARAGSAAASAFACLLI